MATLRLARPSFLLVFAAVFALSGRADEPFRFPEGKHANAVLRYVCGRPVLVVRGSPDEIGEAVGVLAVRPAERMMHYPSDLMNHYLIGASYEPIAAAGRKMFKRFPPDYQRELDAIVRASGADRDDVIVGNTVFDLKKIVSCSSLLVEPDRSATGGPLLGRNLDYPSLGYAQEYSLVTVYKPTGKRSFVSVGFPGLVGCLSGMNDAGLSVAVHEVFQVKLGKKWFDPSGMPYALCYRRLLEECGTIDEARDALERMPRTTITNLAVADRTGVAVFEVTPEHVVVRRGENGTCICTNHFCSDELKFGLAINRYRTYDRFRALDVPAGVRPKIGPADLHQSLHAASMPDTTMQTMIFEPTTLRLHLAIGSRPSSAGEMAVIELKRLLTER